MKLLVVTLNSTVMRIQRVPCEKCLEQQLAQTECSGNISWHDYPKEGSGGGRPKGAFRVSHAPGIPSVPSPEIPGGHLQNVLRWPGGNWAWPGWPSGCQWARRGGGPCGCERHPPPPCTALSGPGCSRCPQHVQEGYFYCVQLTLLAA